MLSMIRKSGNRFSENVLQTGGGERDERSSTRRHRALAVSAPETRHRTMRRGVVWTIVAVPLALIAVVAGTAAALPALCHVCSGLGTCRMACPLSPRTTRSISSLAPTLSRNVSALLPAAIARIEAAHGRPFAHAVTVGVYATPQAYAAANGRGSAELSSASRSSAASTCRLSSTGRNTGAFPPS